MDTDLILALFIFAAFFCGVVWIAKRMRNSGSLNLYAATYEFYDKEQRSAIEQVVEQKVKKMEEEETDKPK
jgi:hypothetical protein